MTVDEKTDQQLYKLGRAIQSERSIVPTVMAKIAERRDERETRNVDHALSRDLQWLRLPAVAAVVLIAIGAALLMVSSNATVLLADQAAAALAAAQADGVRVQERVVAVLADGSTQPSSTRRALTVGHESYRRDIYEGEKLREIQWYTPQPERIEHIGSLQVKISNLGTQQTSVQFDSKTFSLQSHEGNFGDEHPVARMSFLIKFLDKAERRLDPITINGRRCPGFEIRANQYGVNPPDWIDRIWIDPETKLPVRIEQERPTTDKRVKALVTVQDGFEWHPALSGDVFTPAIPEGFTPR